jgi:hypothetical protein
MHVRFSRLVLFMEKWASLILVLILVTAGVAPPVIGITLAIVAILFLFAWNSHFNFEEAAGMPVNRLTVRY